MDIIEEIEKIVKNDILEYKKNAEDHYDFWEEHIQFVYKEAILLAKKYHADEEIVRLGALLHDIALIRKVGTREEHHARGRDIADEILTSFHYPDKQKERVLKCVYNHRSSKNATSLEELCVADADILAHFDNIPMLFHSAYTRKGVSLGEIRSYMREVFQKDFNDLSEHTKKDFKKDYQLICKIVLGESL